MTASRGLSAVAKRAAELGASLRDALTAEQSSLLDATPVDRATSLIRARPRRAVYAQLPPGFAALGAQLAKDGGPDWVSRYQALVLGHLLAALPSAEPALRIPNDLAPLVEAQLALLLGELEGYSVESWADDMFLKDIAVARLQLIPLGYFVADVRRVRPRNVLRHATRWQRLEMLGYLNGGYLRSQLVLGTHSWKGFREVRRGEPWQSGIRRLALLLRANPQLTAYFGESWMTDPRMADISPHLSHRATGLLAMGGRRFRLATSARTVEMALAASASRRKLYDDGLYQPRDYGIIVKRADILRWAESPAAHPELAL